MNGSAIVWLLLGLAVSVYAQTVPLKSSAFTGVNVSIAERPYRSSPSLQIVAVDQLREAIAIVNGFQFTNGTIELEVAGALLAGADAGARGFIGVAFRLSMTDSIRYDCFYLRPANGRAEDQIRRNHSTQYIAHPGYPWFRLRKEFPGMYESYVDLVEGEWTKVKIVVRGDSAKLFVHDASQPTLIVNDLLNTNSAGGIALWVGQGTEGYFSNLKIILE